MGRISDGATVFAVFLYVLTMIAIAAASAALPLVIVWYLLTH